MNRSPLSDFNRRRSLLDSPNLVRFINKTLHTKENHRSHFDSTTTSSSDTYSTYNPLPNPRIAITRKLSNMNEQQSPLQLNRGMNSNGLFSFFSYSLIVLLGIIQLSLITSDNHLTVKSIEINLVLFFFHIDRIVVFLVVRVKGVHQRSSNILVKMTLIPDRKPLECNTRAVPNVNGSAIFNEKFTFEINNDDLHKRLCFSIYNYQQEKNDTQLQGCLSFGIRNTLKKQRVRENFLDFYFKK